MIWSVRLVRTGVERAFAVQLRLWMRRSENNRLLAVISGILSALLLQSATAVAIMVSNFVAAGTLGGAVGLAMLLGADIGSALVVKVLLAKQPYMVPLLLVVGVGLFLRGTKRKTRQVGRILIGLSLIFVSLELIRDATTPLTHSSAIISGMGYLGNDLATAFLIGALFTWAVHSSVAAVLFIVTLVSQGLLTQSAAVAMVMGANLGGVIIAYVLTLSARTAARCVIVANGIIRGSSAMLVLLLLGAFELPLNWLGQSATERVINLHVVFNIAITMIALPILKPIISATATLVHEKPREPVAGLRPSSLDPVILETPEHALVCAAREILHMGEVATGMVENVLPLYQRWSKEQAQVIRADAQYVRATHSAVKLFLAQLERSNLDEAQRRQSNEFSTLAMNMVSVSDLVVRNLLDLAQRLDREPVKFSPQGWQELCDFHHRVLANLQVGLNVIMTREVDVARALLAEKDKIRQLEQDLQRKHLQRLQQGSVRSVETSNIHQETLRILKQLTGNFAPWAHAVLADTGIRRDSRL